MAREDCQEVTIVNETAKGQHKKQKIYSTNSSGEKPSSLAGQTLSSLPIKSPTISYLDQDTWVKYKTDNVMVDSYNGGQSKCSVTIGWAKKNNREIQDQWFTKYFEKPVSIRVVSTKRFRKNDNDVPGMVIFIDEPTHSLHPRVYMQPESKHYRKHLLDTFRQKVDYNEYHFAIEGEIYKHQFKQNKYWGELHYGTGDTIGQQLTLLPDQYSIDTKTEDIVSIKATDLEQLEGDESKGIRYGIRIKKSPSKDSVTSLSSLKDKITRKYRDLYFGTKDCRDEWWRCLIGQN